MNSMKIHWICAEITHYHAYFFNALSADCEIDLTVHFEKEFHGRHPWKKRPELRFKYYMLDLRWGLDPTLFRLALDGSNRFVIAGWHRPFLILLALWLTVLRRDFLFWSDVPDPSKRRSIAKRMIRSIVSRFFFRAAKNLMSTGEPGLKAFAAMGAPPGKLVAFPYFAEITPYDPSWKEISAGEPVTIVSLGALTIEHKGQDVAVEALGRLKDLIGPGRFRYYIGGTGQDFERLKILVDKHGIRDDVEFLGWLEIDEVTALLQRSHMMLHPARWEPFGVAVLEAMVNGVVVLGSAGTCAVLDRIQHGVNGFIHEVGDAAAIMEQLTIVIHDRERLHKMGCAARKTAEKWPASRGVEIVKSAFSG